MFLVLLQMDFLTLSLLIYEMETLWFIHISNQWHVCNFSNVRWNQEMLECYTSCYSFFFFLNSCRVSLNKHYHRILSGRSMATEKLSEEVAGNAEKGVQHCPSSFHIEPLHCLKSLCAFISPEQCSQQHLQNFPGMCPTPEHMGCEYACASALEGTAQR